jgi:hypothetical protein
MTIQQTLSLLNSITSKYANTLYDETSFHGHFSKSSLGESDRLGRSFDDVEYSMNNLIYEIQVDQDKFIYQDYDNLSKPKLHINDLKFYGIRSSFRKTLDNTLNHLQAIVQMPHIHDLDINHDYMNRLSSIRAISDQLMDSVQFDQKFENKVQIMNRQLEFSFHQPKEKAFIISKIKKLASECPVLDDTNVRSIFNTFKEEYIKLADDCKALVKQYSPNEFHCMADRFIQAVDKGETPIQQFLINKQHNVETTSEIKFTKSQQNQEAYIFADDSIVVKNREGSYKKILGSVELRQLNVQLHTDAIDYMLRKRPQVSKFFKSKFQEERAFSAAINAVATFNENETILKNKSIDLTHFKDKSFENIDDYIHSIKKIHQVEQFAGSILSAKYKHFLNDTTFKYFETLHDQDFGQKELQMYIGKKLAAIKTEDDMIEILQSTINLLSGFSSEKVMEKLDSLNITPILYENNRLIFEVTSHDECKQLGSPAWCIVREESYFDQYTDDGNRQYICYDFNKDQSDYESMLGFTYTIDGDLHTAHYKNDDYLELSIAPELEKAFEKSLYLNKDNHQFDNNRLSELEKKYSNKKKNQNGVKLL